jgi:hypothetical protein
MARRRSSSLASVPDETETGPAPGDCLACRGTGQVTSNLGGEPSLTPCPWCEGSGVRLTGHDAQARWRALQDAPSSGERRDADAQAA